MAAPTRIRLSYRAGGYYVDKPGPMQGEYVDAQSFDAAATALRAAYMGLRSAENQFAAMRESQNAGHFPEVHNNPEKFAEKADAAARALTELGIPTSPAPASNDLAEVRRTAPGTGEGRASSCGAGTAQAEGESQPSVEGTAAATPSASAGDGGHPPKDAPSAGGDGPESVLAAALTTRSSATPEVHAVRMLKALNDAGYSILREAELDAIAAARSAA